MDKCYFCDQFVNNNYLLLSCSKSCFKKCHLNCFNQYENYLISLVGYPNYYSNYHKRQLIWTHDFHLICNRIKCNCQNTNYFKHHIDNQDSLFYYGTNFAFAQHQLKKKN